MRIPRTANHLLKLTTILAVAAISVVTASSNKTTFTKHDKAYYADANTINFVRPGLDITVQSAAIAADGTITAKIKITDPKGLGLDREGITTPGAVTVSCVAAVIPNGQTQYTAYTTRNKVSTYPPTAGKSAIQASTDAGGTWAKGANDGEYTYTFATKAPSGFDKSATHSIGCQSSRNLTEFDMSTYYDSSVYTFVPDGSKVTTVRDIVRTANCNRCHDQLAFHGGSRRGTDYCIMCHQPQTTNPETGNTVNFPVMIHKIHNGPDLPSVKAGTPYTIVGFGNNVSDFSDVTFPGDVRNCEVCHDQKSGATQAAQYMKPTRAACGACHDDVNFSTGENHVNLPQVTDNQCSTCHIPQGELVRDASIKGAHTIVEALPSLAPNVDAPGLVFTLDKVQDGVPGKNPTVTFTIKDYSGNPLTFAQIKDTNFGRVGLVLAGPTEPDYGYTQFTGPAVLSSGYVSEDPTTGANAAKCDANGTCTYTFVHGIPADAKGTFTIMIEGRRGLVVLPGTKKQVTTEIGATNKLLYFSVDGSPVVERRKVVATEKCNGCHQSLATHGQNRNRVEACVICHNPSETDKPTKAQATNPADKNTPLQAVDFKFMIHRIHTGEKMKEMGVDSYVIVGFGGSHNDFSDVKFPAMSPTGATGDRRNCSMCHINGSETNLPTGRLDETNPQGPINPMPATTAACTACHASLPVASHAKANTTSLGESCDTCHGPKGEFSVTRVHAR